MEWEGFERITMRKSREVEIVKGKGKRRKGKETEEKWYNVGEASA